MLLVLRASHSAVLVVTVLLCGVVLLHTLSLIFFFFFFNDTATTEIYTLSLHDALPIDSTTCVSSTDSGYSSDLEANLVQIIVVAKKYDNDQIGRAHV